MKLFFLFVLLTGCAYAQMPANRIQRDSIPSVFPPDLMPNARSTNSFYRYQMDPRTIMRATLDNMPVKVPDSSTHYTMLRSFQKYVKPEEPMRILKPQPRIIPK